MGRRDVKVEILKAIPGIERALSSELRAVAALVDYVHLQPETVLACEGDRAAEGFLIVDGHICVTSGGRKLAELGAGDFAGEAALLDGGPRSATLTVDGPATAFVFEARRFAALREVPTVRDLLLRQLAGRLRTANAAVS